MGARTIVTINGSTNQDGIISIRVKRSINAPAQLTLAVNSVRGSRAFEIKRGDTIKIQASPHIHSIIPTIFYGFVTEVDQSNNRMIVNALDTLGRLGQEYITTNPLAVADDVAGVISEIISGSSYSLSIDRIIGHTGIRLPDNMNFIGKTRLAAVQMLLQILDNSPNSFMISADETGILMRKIFDPFTTGTGYPTALVGGRFPATGSSYDFRPTFVDRIEGDLDFFNTVTVSNSSKDIRVTEPATAVSQPVQIFVEESSVTDTSQARLWARQYLNGRGSRKVQWQVECMPNNFYVIPGDVAVFYEVEGGLAGRQMVFDVLLDIDADSSLLSLTIGQPAPDLVSTLRLAAGVSV